MAESPHRIRNVVYYNGRVQGVGFRWNAANEARGFSVDGYVRNLPDGRVELVAEGTRDEVARFLEAIRQRMGACIRDEQISDMAASGEFQSFEIRT